MLAAPYSQMLLEWDAANYDEMIREGDKAMAELTSAINRLGKVEGASSERAQLMSRRVRLRDELAKRNRLFWFGRDPEGES